jgi:hypothetical protein
LPPSEKKSLHLRMDIPDLEEFWWKTSESGREEFLRGVPRRLDLDQIEAEAVERGHLAPPSHRAWRFSSSLLWAKRKAGRS